MSAIYNHPLCQVPECDARGYRNTDTDLTLCDHHEAYILFIRSLVEAQHDQGELSEKDMIDILKREGQALAYPKTGSPRLTLIEGGIGEDPPNAQRESNRPDKQRRSS